jgi:uncharacterized membrane protein YcaP (DUF421 family)
MSLAAIAARAAFAYLTLLLLVRASGKQSIRHATTFEFVIAVIVGDMVDDAILAESSVAAFIVAVVTLFVTHWAIEYANYRAGAHGG